MTEEQIDILVKFAKLFEIEHQTIRAEGATTIEEYHEIWHVYKDEVRPIIEGEL